MPIQESRLVNDFLELIQINTPPRQEAPVADRLEAQLQALGFETTRDDAGTAIGGNTGNVIAFKKGTVPGAPSIMLNAHMDTVQPTAGLVPVIEDGWIKTSGDTILGADDKAGVAAIMEGVRVLLEAGEAHGDLEIVFSISEETGLLGAKHMDFSKVRSRLAYVFDSGPPAGALVHSAPTHEVFHVTFRGVAAHAAVAPERGVNAILAASKAIARMRLGRLDERTTCNVGVIHGGAATNVVPDTVQVDAEARSRDPETLEQLVREMTAAFEAGAAEVGAEVEIEIDRHYHGSEIPVEDDLVRWAQEAADGVGFVPVIRPGAGGSDANIFNANGLKALVIGVGYYDPHGVNERIEIADMVRAAEMARALVRRVAREGQNAG
ncbi:MAG: M20/M25/M40 family metallo-hydrolase [Armatimonadetes bacterium]|nr:M20/M25/M40 family metallo-hydrolase [Armatimonadota bacterium]